MPLLRPKVSATAVEKGKTVDEPTMLMVSRAMAWAEREPVATAMAAAIKVLFTGFRSKVGDVKEDQLETRQSKEC